MTMRSPAEVKWLLALDTSTDRASAALTDGRRVAELSWDARRNQTATLLSAVDQLMTLEGVGLGEVSAIAVATGPGAFTSLRVGLSTAKGLAFARGLPLIGVPTLDGAARPFAETGLETIAVIAAGRGRLAWARYGPREGGWSQLVAPRNGDITVMAAEIERHGRRPYITGELNEEQAVSIRRVGGIVPPVMLRERRVAGLVTIAWERFSRGEFDDAVSLVPMYLHAASAASDPI
ncbi:MAG TPA: tRNA (adenosine(37)-N6)-threonylcarbamoyltransferase complex dimerization subunit type 1 TsaB [Thermomicrobiales bacterium]|nr:tRNA (adenosine(37)-N6)-threonylcarbamoyltransferase complex dimerization subunit type 1 TsaB [Thermomicrobiales bacterium]